MAWELASGSSKESGLSALFRGASLLTRRGEAISVLSGLKNRTALLYFASSTDVCKKFTPHLRKFYELAKESDDSIVVIFVSDDETKEDQLAYFQADDMHPDWLMVELLGVEDIMDNFEVKKIPSLVVLDREGKSAVDGARDQIWDMVQANRKDPVGLKAAVGKAWAEWRKAAGDWRASEGHTLGGGGASGSSSGGAVAAAHVGGAPGAVQAPGTRSDREALRAARLAALERRGLSVAGGSSGSAAAFPTESSSASSAAPGAAASAASGMASGAAASPPSGGGRACAGGAAALGGPSASGAAAGSGSGTFAAGAAGAAGLGGTAYTLAGGRIELPSAPAPRDATSEDEDASDMASVGERSFREEGDLPEIDTAQAVQQIADMGFPEDAARRALQASNGDVDQAVAMLLGE